MWVVFAAPGSGSGSTDLIESGSNADPKHWFFYPASWCAAHTVSYTTMGQRGCYLLALQDWRDNTLSLSYSDGRLPILKLMFSSTHKKNIFYILLLKSYFFSCTVPVICGIFLFVLSSHKITNLDWAANNSCTHTNVLWMRSPSLF